MKLYLEEYIRQNTGMQRAKPPEEISSQDFSGGFFEADPALNELWGVYMDPTGRPFLKIIGRRAPDVPPGKL